ncbi:MAG TPA: amidohydrolase family protein [Xanthobacteraceae bacterium]|nr:amidohydrolase family protein [Xanthobacteraceae bacterium]
MREIAQPPDPNPKKPKLALPPGACDCHIHLFGPKAKFPFAADATYESREALPETNIALQDRVGLSRAVVVSGGAYGRNYAVLADALARFPARFRGVALMPEQASPAEFDKLTKLGVRGLRFISAARGNVLPHIHEAAAARAFEHGWHVQFYPHGTDLVEHADRLLKLPNAIVLDHFASIPVEGGTEQPAFKTLLKMLDTGRVWVKISGPMRCTRQEYPYTPVTALARELVAHAPHRLVWGTDWPHVNMNDRAMPNDGDLVDLLSEWIPDAATRKRILVDNACELYGFPPV